MSKTRKNIVIIVLLLVGLLQIIGEIIGSRTIRDLGMATAASPAPRIFSSIKGFEPFSNSVFLEWKGPLGSDESILMTPDLYADLEGPFSRRNIFVSILTLGPILSIDSNWDTLFRALSRYALCGLRPLLGELGVNTQYVIGNVSIELFPLDINNTEDLDFSLEVRCS